MLFAQKQIIHNIKGSSSLPRFLLRKRAGVRGRAPEKGVRGRAPRKTKENLMPALRALKLPVQKFFDNISGARFCFVVYFSDIFTDNAQREQLYTAYHPDRADN